MTAGRRMYLGLQLLDRQLVARDDRLAGKVDDVELTLDEDGQLYVSALLTGPGVLAQRMRRMVYGPWAQRVVERLAGDRYTTRVPLAVVADISSRVRVSVDREDLATAAIDRWVDDHIIDHIPGSGSAPE
jgi:hypothetical protein